tara:strand:+ start:7271 stop:7456 length:186 start_codon:yes stop_codon:yes gene_type:complete
MNFINLLLKIFTGIFGLLAVSSVLLGYEFLKPLLTVLNNHVGFFLLLIWITLLMMEVSEER